MRASRVVVHAHAGLVDARMSHHHCLPFALAHQHPQLAKAGSRAHAVSCTCRLKLVNVHSHTATTILVQREERSSRSVHAGEDAQADQGVANGLARFASLCCAQHQEFGMKKSIIITGAGRGIGAATARTFLEAG